jgi:PAS domain S-box-containing protein
MNRRDIQTNKVKCWEVFQCNKKECPAYKSRDLKCWLFPGTHCRDEIQGKFIDKMEMCIDCKPFQMNLDTSSMTDTCKVFSEQLKEYKGIVEDRDRELENISIELAVGLSEVFEALKSISSGDPLVRIPEISNIELINKLKHLVNLTAQNIEEIVDLSHEFAIGLAEHFDVLHKVSKGDINTRVSDKPQESLLKALGKVTNQMIESVSREITERKRAEERFKQVAESAGEWIWEVDRNGLYTYSNHVVEKILGYSPEEIVGKKYYYDFFEPGTRTQLKEKVIAAFNEKKPFRDVIYANIHKMGHIVFLETSGTPVLGEKGDFLGYRGVDTDITERKLAEEHLRKSLREKEILLRELHHRTKNNLQVISSLLDLHSINIEDKNILNIIKEVQHRIKSIALVHEKLYHAKDLSDVNLRDYITDFAHALLKSYEGIKGRISLKVGVVDDIFLSLDTITPCGMIISELVSNSLKYAFPDGRKGKITIECHSLGDGEVKLRICDDGIGLPKGLDFRNTKSLGFKLICNLAETQLRGTVEQESRKGTAFLIKFREIKKLEHIIEL